MILNKFLLYGAGAIIVLLLIANGYLYWKSNNLEEKVGVLESDLTVTKSTLQITKEAMDLKISQLEANKKDLDLLEKPIVKTKTIKIPAEVEFSDVDTKSGVPSAIGRIGF